MQSRTHSKKIELALMNLERILDREWECKGDAKEKHKQIFMADLHHPDGFQEKIYKLAEGNFYFLRKDMPELKFKGEHNLILDIGYGLVAKARYCKGNEVSNRIIMSLLSYEPCLKETLVNLEHMGIKMPRHSYVGIRREGNNFRESQDYLSFAIAPDLTEGSRYVVEDLTEEHFSTLGNGQNLRNEYLQQSKIVLDAIRQTEEWLFRSGPEPKYHAELKDQLPRESPQEAVRHMFFVQIDPEANDGRLVLGELDHVMIYEVKKYHDATHAHNITPVQN